MAAKVFISYRRNDTKYQARMIYDALREVLPPEHVFMDIDSIPLGSDYVETLEKWVAQSDVVLALIGALWLALDSKTGRTRLSDPNDFVYIETREALRKGIPVVPVLIDGTTLPQPDQLPEDLKPLLRRQAAYLDYRTIDVDIKKLIERLPLNPAKPSPGFRPSPRGESSSPNGGWLSDLLTRASREDSSTEPKLPTTPPGSRQQDTAWLPRPVRSSLSSDEAAHQPNQTFGVPPIPESATQSGTSRKRTVLKAGVINGEPYRLYSDGSIEIMLQNELRRFASIDDLRKHIGEAK